MPLLRVLAHVNITLGVDVIESKIVLGNDSRSIGTT